VHYLKVVPHGNLLNIRNRQLKGGYILDSSYVPPFWNVYMMDGAHTAFLEF
jgi:hypothetical protein